MHTVVVHLLANVLAISDLQCPFEHQDALAFCLHAKKTFFPDIEPHIVNMGDEADQHTLSGKFIADPNGKSAGDELEEAKLRLRDWFRAFPNCKVCISNHTYRVYKKAFNAGIPSQFLYSIGDVYGAPPGWTWHDRILVHDVLFEHGENVSGPTAAINAAVQNQRCTVIGHQHANGGVIHRHSYDRTLWGLNTGCLIDVDKYAFEYGKTLRNKPTLGCGIVRNGNPYFVPMILNQKKRWVGYI